MAKRFSHTVRYIDDLLTLNNTMFEGAGPAEAILCWSGHAFSQEGVVPRGQFNAWA